MKGLLRFVGSDPVSALVGLAAQGLGSLALSGFELPHDVAQGAGVFLAIELFLVPRGLPFAAAIFLPLVGALRRRAQLTRRRAIGLAVLCQMLPVIGCCGRRERDGWGLSRGLLLWAL